MSSTLDAFGIPVAAESASEKPTYHDSFIGGEAVAFKFGFLGCGQAGGKMAHAFHKIGYRSVCAVNTAVADLTELPLDVAAKLNLGTAGAGKDPAAGARALAPRTEDLYDLLKRSWDPQLDYAFVCFGAGGGSGAGMFAGATEVIRRLVDDHGAKTKIGAIVALPKVSEGSRPAKNTLGVIKELKSLSLSPVLVVDNDRIEKIYPRLPVAVFYETANTATASLLHAFNRLSAQASAVASFDPTDLSAVFAGGLVTLGAQKVADLKDDAAASEVIRKQLKSTVLAPFDLATGNRAGLVFVLGADAARTVPDAVLDYGVVMLTRTLQPGSTVYKGVYFDDIEGVAVLACVGGLKWPEDRLAAMSKLAGLG